ncbi:hypothetical protein ACFLZ1_05310, partial [Patescibacteria group bacterium]
MITYDAKIFILLQKIKISRFIKIFIKFQWVKILVILGFLFVALILGLFTYFFSKASFMFLQTYPQFLASMVFYILATWFFLIFLLTLGSSFISSMAMFFSQEDDDLLLSFPIKSQLIFESRFLDLLIINSWPTLVFGVPLLMSFHHSFNLDSISFILSILVLMLVLLISGFISSILALVITYFSGSIGKKIINIVSIISLPFFAWGVATILIPPNLTENFQKLHLEEISAYLKSLPINSLIFPSTWAVNIIYYWQESRLFALLNLERMLLFLSLLILTAYILVKKIYYSSLNKANVGRFIAGKQDIISKNINTKVFPYFLKSIKGAFIEKD